MSDASLAKTAANRRLAINSSVEAIIFIAGVYLYLTATKPKDKTGTFASWGLIVFLALSYTANLAGPAPTDTKILGYSGLSLWLLVLWAYWADRHRYVP